MDYLLYTFADNWAYEEPQRWKAAPTDRRFADIPRGLVPVEHRPGWDIQRHGIWTVCRPAEHEFARQGWKLHLSVTQDSFDRVVATAAQYCHDRQTAFKFLARREYAWMMNAKYASRNQSGKGVAIYPADETESISIARDLVELFGSESGPRILSDIQIGGIVHARYGAYTRRYCRDEHGGLRFAMDSPLGEPIPDPRSVPFRAPDFVTVPKEFASVPLTDDGPLPPYRIDKTLHLSNSGGVYVGEKTDTGDTIVLKEARPFAGQDLLGGDAVARGIEEAAALRRYAGMSTTPRLVETFTWQSHHFIAMEYVRGTTLISWSAARHPLLTRSDPYEPPHPDQMRDYAAKIGRILAQVQAAVQVMWDDGYVFGDLHPGNVMVRPDLGVRLLDFEACRPAGERPSFYGAPGFADLTKRSGIDADRYALAMMELYCYVPLTQLIRMDSGKLAQLTEYAAKMFGLDAQWTTRILDATRDPSGNATANITPRPTAGPRASESGHLSDGFEVWASRVVEGLRRTMDSHRTERLFRCDASGFALSPVALATGSAGVLWALSGTNGVHADDLVGSIVDWTVDRGRAMTGRPECGLYDSELGAALALARAGASDHARALASIALAKDTSNCGANVFDGLAGIYLACRELALGGEVGVDSGVLKEIGTQLLSRARTLSQRIEDEPSRVDRFGLMHGAAGVALAVHRHGVSTGDTSAVALAHRLLEQEFAGYVRCGDGSLQFDESGGRTLGYLEVGSTGAALVLAEITKFDGWLPKGVGLEDLYRAAGPESMVQCGLFRGRAGFAAVLATLRNSVDDDRIGSLVTRHWGHLGLHEIHHGDAVHYPGARNIKLSDDLRTGTAGVLTAVSFVEGRRDSWLPGVC